MRFLQILLAHRFEAVNDTWVLFQMVDNLWCRQRHGWRLQVAKKQNYWKRPYLASSMLPVLQYDWFSLTTVWLLSYVEWWMSDVLWFIWFVCLRKSSQWSDKVWSLPCNSVKTLLESLSTSHHHTVCNAGLYFVAVNFSFFIFCCTCMCSYNVVIWNCRKLIFRLINLFELTATIRVFPLCLSLFNIQFNVHYKVYFLLWLYNALCVFIPINHCCAVT